MCHGAPSSREPPAGWPPRAFLVWILVSMFTVSFAVVLVTVLAFCCRLRRDRSGSTSEHGGCAALPGTRGGDPFPADALPAFAYYARDRSGEHGAARQCAVCLGAVREGEMVRRLPACMHVYHVECIDRWLAARPTCPLCRSKLDPCKVRSDLPVPQVQDDPPDQLSA